MRFLNATLYGKRLVGYPECKLQKFATSSTFRSITSMDRVPVEYKGRGTFNALGARRDILQPSVGGDRLLLHSVRPEALDQNALAIKRLGSVVCALDSKP